MDDFINQLTSIASTWSTAGALAGLILLVNLLTNLTKVSKIAAWVPAAWRARIAAGLGGVGGLLTALVAGKPLPAALFSGLIIGLGAIGTHELVTGMRPTVQLMRLKRRVMAVTTKGATVMLIIITLSCTISCHGQCATPAEANSLVCAAESGVVDCTKPEVMTVVTAFLPLALTLAMHLMGADGAVDWDSFAGVAKAVGWRDGQCLYQRVVEEVTNPKTLTASSTPHIDLELQADYAMAARAKTWPGTKVKTARGVR